MPCIFPQSCNEPTRVSSIQPWIIFSWEDHLLIFPSVDGHIFASQSWFTQPLQDIALGLYFWNIYSGMNFSGRCMYFGGPIGVPKWKIALSNTSYFAICVEIVEVQCHLIMVRLHVGTLIILPTHPPPEGYYQWQSQTVARREGKSRAPANNQFYIHDNAGGDTAGLLISDTHTNN